LEGAVAGRVAVIGALNVDRVFRCRTLPAAGETVLAVSLTRGFGGKGGNQAAAAARFGARTSMVGAVGGDADGAEAVDDLRRLGVDTGHVRVVAGRETGQAAVLTAADGRNAIVVAAGANAALSADDVGSALATLRLTAGDVVLASAEVAEECAAAAAEACSAAAARMIYNLAPARPVTGWVARHRPLLVLNEVEAAQAAGTADPAAAADVLARSAAGVVLTLGARGARYVVGAQWAEVPAPAAARVLDTTGAGDAFCGVLAAELAAGRALRAAVITSVAAGTWAVGAIGARGALARPGDLRR
jgi:ribokinase